MLAVLLVVMTVAALAVVVAPLLKGGRAAPERAQFDRAVYRDQLQEVARDEGRGLIGAEDAATARLEIERRLLATDRGAAAPAVATRPTPILAAVLALVVAGGAAGLYLSRGAPGVPDLPFASRDAERARVAANGAGDLAAAAVKLAARLAQNPNDTEGWLLDARTLAALQRWDKAADAYRRALTLTQDRPDIESAYGEMLVMAASGIVTPAAHDAFASAVAKDPQAGPARYYLALADAQAGNNTAAIDAWQKLAAESPVNAPIRAELQQRVAEAASAAGIPAPPLAASTAPAGPSAEQMAAGAEMPPEQRSAMIHGMVDKLAAELAASPGDLDGWLRLARAYTVLGDKDKAADAYEHAAKLAPDNADIPLGEAEALLAGHDLHDPMPERALALLQRVTTLSPDEPAALWYLGLAAAQAHRFDEAAERWQHLLATLPPDAPERKTVTAALDAIKAK